jgi:NADH-quinone oxidoreductase subunit M
MILPLFIVPFTTFFLINVINWAFKTNSLNFLQTKILGSNFKNITKVITLASLHLNLAYSVYLWKQYPEFIQKLNLYIYPTNSWFELHHNLNLPFVILSCVILIISLLTIWYLEINIVFFLNLILLLEFCLIGAFSCVNIFIFLFFFEVSAIPIFLLIVYCGSARRERIKASYYFLFFTLYGSLSLLLALITIYSYNQIEFIQNSNININLLLFFLLFIAFAVKIPLFPVHIWLPYAHVEASTTASILLAALMLKLGGYGLIKYLMPLFFVDLHLYFRPAAFGISVIGVIYGAFAALRQIDLKRLIAFSSISHMSFATLGIFSYSEVGLKGAVYLMLSHGLTSSALFFLVGILSDRYHTRSILIFGGLLLVMPFFIFFLIISSLTNVGFPGTSGFLPELLIIISLLHTVPSLILLVLFGMFLTTAGSLVVLFRLIFGHLKTEYTWSNFTDLTRLESFILSFLSCFMIFFGLQDFFFHPFEIIV